MSYNAGATETHGTTPESTTMSKPNGRQKEALEGLAAALTECFDAAVEAGEKRAEKRTERRLEADKVERAAEREKDRDTLRMFWRQFGGSPDQRLPIDD